MRDVVGFSLPPFQLRSDTALVGGLSPNFQPGGDALPVAAHRCGETVASQGALRRESFSRRLATDVCLLRNHLAAAAAATQKAASCEGTPRDPTGESAAAVGPLAADATFFSRAISEATGLRAENAQLATTGDVSVSSPLYPEAARRAFSLAFASPAISAKASSLAGGGGAAPGGSCVEGDFLCSSPRLVGQARECPFDERLDSGCSLLRGEVVTGANDSEADDSGRSSSSDASSSLLTVVASSTSHEESDRDEEWADFELPPESLAAFEAKLLPTGSAEARASNAALSPSSPPQGLQASLVSEEASLQWPLKKAALVVRRRSRRDALKYVHATDRQTQSLLLRTKANFVGLAFA